MSDSLVSVHYLINFVAGYSVSQTKWYYFSQTKWYYSGREYCNILVRIRLQTSILFPVQIDTTVRHMFGESKT